MKKIKLCIFDFDGVFTNGKCYFLNDTIQKYYNIKDGKAIGLLRERNIKTGLISSYKSQFSITYNDCIENIAKHLNFDYYHQGSEDKLTILNDWISKYKIDLSEIAYIGDDLNDIPLLKIVGFSACPNDAVEECKQISKYICKKKGGEGCVREFVEFILNSELDLQNHIINTIKYESTNQLENYRYFDFNKIIELINTHTSIYFTGVGKSLTMAQYLCNLLKSISINAHILSTLDALHGDIGTVKNTDIVFMFSKSGNTYELLNIIPHIQNLGCKVAGLCLDKNSKFLNQCNYVFELPFMSEIGFGDLTMIPTNSSLSFMYFSNILITLLKQNVSLEIYGKNHPNGSIGDCFKTVGNVLVTSFPKIILLGSVNIHDVFLEMTAYKTGCCLFVNEYDNLLGILTDGDIRRLLLENENLKYITLENINKKYYAINNLDMYINSLKRYTYIPVVVENKLKGIVSYINI
jgi:YrbI family 3-deoxy-D-manno-octulosonate 8-phosphate phosphatase